MPLSRSHVLEKYLLSRRAHSACISACTIQRMIRSTPSNIGIPPFHRMRARYENGEVNQGLNHDLLEDEIDEVMQSLIPPRPALQVAGLLMTKYSGQFAWALEQTSSPPPPPENVVWPRFSSDHMAGWCLLCAGSVVREDVHSHRRGHCHPTG